MSKIHIKTGYAILATTAGFVAYKLIKSAFQIAETNSKCIVIEKADDWEANEKEIIKVFEKSRVIGLDCEWVTDGKRREPISLLQLANESGYCVLIRMCKLQAWLIPKGLSELLMSDKILKVGVGIYDDVNKLFEDYGLEVRHFVDLRFLASRLPEMQGKNLGLKSLSSELLNIELNKSARIRCSNWSVPHLTHEQIKYAIDDVTVAAKLFFKIKSLGKGWIFNFSTNFDKELLAYINVKFKQNYVNNTENPNTSRAPPHSNKNRYSKPRLKPMYDNCQLVAPDGEILCSCDKGKAEWYVMKGLGSIVSDQPLKVMLNFEPSGRPTLDNVFYTMEKLNCCVVCGKTNQFHRKLVIPSEYRKYFPNLMKKNLSHDVLLLCVNCHKKSNMIDQVMRQKLAEMCDAPLGCRKNVRFQCNPQLARVKSAAKAIVKAGDKLPEARKIALEDIVKNYFEVPYVDENILDQALHVDINMLNEAYIAHGQKVFEHFCQNGGLMEFEKMWRQHFLDTMNPQHLPEMWSIDHNHKRLAMQVINQEREVDFDPSILGIKPELVKEIENENEQ